VGCSSTSVRSVHALGGGFSYFTCLVALGVAPPDTARAAEVDLELVLAVDVSQSMDVDELRVQRDGYIAAFRHPDVMTAIRSGPLDRIAVTYIEWSGPEIQMTVVPWTLIEDENPAQAFAARLSVSTLRPYAGTSISGGLLYAAAAFDKNQFTSPRQVIDISGDGPNNRALPVEPVRSQMSASMSVAALRLELVLPLIAGSTISTSINASSSR
jgi:hypothetical protein